MEPAIPMAMSGGRVEVGLGIKARLFCCGSSGL